jgi:hypothetical protein
MRKVPRENSGPDTPWVERSSISRGRQSLRPTRRPGGRVPPRSIFAVHGPANAGASVVAGWAIEPMDADGDLRRVRQGGSFALLLRVFASRCDADPLSRVTADSSDALAF